MGLSPPAVLEPHLHPLEHLRRENCKFNCFEVRVRGRNEGNKVRAPGKLVSKTPTILGTISRKHHR